MLALALFSLEAGLAQIALARDDACRAAATSLRVGLPDGSGCMSELVLAATQALARGPAGPLFPKASSLVAWAFSGVVYAVVGAVCAQLTPGWAVGTYLGVHGFLLAAGAFLTFISKYVTL
jgi:hypothetical protein